MDLTGPSPRQRHGANLPSSSSTFPDPSGQSQPPSQSQSQSQTQSASSSPYVDLNNSPSAPRISKLSHPLSFTPSPLSGSFISSSASSALRKSRHMSRRQVVRLALLGGAVLVSVLWIVGLITGGNESGEGERGVIGTRLEGAKERYRAAGDAARRVWNNEGIFASGLGTGLGTGTRGGEGTEEVWVNLEEELPTTRFEGGIPGYTLWSNLYVSSGGLLAVQPDRRDPTEPEWLATRQIMSGEKRPTGATGPRTRRGGGSSMRVWRYIFADGPGGEGYLVYFRHFVLEAFLGATRMMAHVLSGGGAGRLTTPVPRRVWFPHCGSKPSWRDDRGENVWFLSHALPAATVEDANGWTDRANTGLPFILEKAVIIDRWAAHSVGGEVGKWGKMNAASAALTAPMSFWEPFRTNMMRTLGVDGGSRIGNRRLPVVVYIDRQKESPKLVDADHDALVEALKGLTSKAEVHVSKLSAMTKAQQVELIGRAEIVVALHGDELMSTLWMPATPRSTLLAKSTGHRYVAIHNDRIVDEDEWREIGIKRGDNAKGEIRVDGKVIANLVEDILGRPGK
ncbi:hypothetical protein EHS25_008840 [Saitozyma podzolica]|uniref:Uncharacterized protein n=1 Tax=Saitozyma podzolica TaxID=1890683 RepID=A0A427YMW6_9TREE|nr:hypothetical protein EHS25_008840 [Saitozyma podzolica]